MTLDDATTYHLPAGKALGGPYVVDVTPEKARWGYSSLRVLELPPGGESRALVCESSAILAAQLATLVRAPALAHAVSA